MTVETSTWELFTCAIQLIIFNKNPLDHLYDVVLGRDWFSLCSTALENYPDTAVHLLSLNQWLIFASLSVDAVHAQLLPYSKSLCFFFFFFFFFFLRVVTLSV